MPMHSELPSELHDTLNSTFQFILKNIEEDDDPDEPGLIMDQRVMRAHITHIAEQQTATNIKRLLTYVQRESKRAENFILQMVQTTEKDDMQSMKENVCVTAIYILFARKIYAAALRQAQEES